MDVHLRKVDIGARKVDIEAPKVNVHLPRVDLEARRVDVEVRKVDVDPLNLAPPGAVGEVLPGPQPDTASHRFSRRSSVRSSASTPASTRSQTPPPGERVTCGCAPAEQLHLADGSASLITVAQAAHWFDLPAFYREVRRVGAPGGVVALISYGVLNLEPARDERFRPESGPPAGDVAGYACPDAPFAPSHPRTSAAGSGRANR